MGPLGAELDQPLEGVVEVAVDDPGLDRLGVRARSGRGALLRGIGLQGIR
jgi:hypothetical protein